MSNRVINACLAGTALLLSACQSAPVARAPDYTQYDPAYSNAPVYGASPYAQQRGAGYYEDVEPAAGYAPPSGLSSPVATQAAVPQAQAVAAPVAQSGALEAEIIRLQERLQRVERAMLRLDRRMQLVERNELGRMSGGVSMNPVEEQSAMAEMNLGPQQAVPASMAAPVYGDGFQAVATPITSALQAAPRSQGRVDSGTSSQLAMRALPSLADPVQSSVKQKGEVAIWTVRYEPTKVWPDRGQLPSSRDIVALLRENRNLSIFARGNQPNSVEFRERVKAISRYLSKVSSQESVPIAAMSASHLDKDTIEIFASP